MCHMWPPKLTNKNSKRRYHTIKLYFILSFLSETNWLPFREAGNILFSLYKEAIRFYNGKERRGIHKTRKNMVQSLQFWGKHRTIPALFCQRISCLTISWMIFKFLGLQRACFRGADETETLNEITWVPEIRNILGTYSGMVFGTPVRLWWGLFSGNKDLFPGNDPQGPHADHVYKSTSGEPTDLTIGLCKINTSGVYKGTGTTPPRLLREWARNWEPHSF